MNPTPIEKSENQTDVSECLSVYGLATTKNRRVGMRFHNRIGVEGFGLMMYSFADIDAIPEVVLFSNSKTNRSGRIKSTKNLNTVRNILGSVFI
jgi:hypothetical protein